MKAMYLNENQFTEVSPEIFKLVTLEHLELSDNLITRLPVEIRQLTNLSHLDLRNNQLCDLPPVLGQLGVISFLGLDEWHDLKLEGNPNLDIPADILEAGTPAVLDYLRKQSPA